MKLRIATLAAATVMTLASCASAITYEEWKAKVDAAETHQYKTAVVNGEYKMKIAGQDTSIKLNDVGFTYDGNNWTSNHADASKVEDFVGITAKQYAASKIDEDSLKNTKFYSDLSIEFKYALEASGTRAEFEGSLKFDKYTYVKDYKVETNITAGDEMVTYIFLSFTVDYSD